MDGCDAVRHDQDRDVDPSVTVRSGDDAIPTTLQFYGLRVLSYTSQIIVDNLQQITVLREYFVIAVITAIRATVKMRMLIICTKNHQHSVGARDLRRIRTRPHSVEDQPGLKGGASLNKNRSEKPGEDMKVLHAEVLAWNFLASIFLNKI